ncbi:AaceriAFL023Cp [[Ashbya] aceris (nom. inval.)]|nr:AaceriAFL023Cp [[Ashbya] aceris (nom. inval.)]
MRLLIGSDDSGCVKELVANRGTNTSEQSALQPLHLEAHLERGLSGKVNQMLQVSEYECLLARASGDMELVSLSRERRGGEEGKPEFEVSSLQVTATLQGLLDGEKMEELHKRSQRRAASADRFVALFALPGQPQKYFAATMSGQFHFLELADGGLRLEKTFAVRGPVEFAQLYDLGEETDKLLFAYGGEENLIKLVEVSRDLEQLEQIWEAKNVKNDRLDLKVPIWPVALRFMRPAASAASEGLNYQFLAVTRHSHLQFYQTIHGRKPLKSIELLPNREPTTSLEIVGDVTPLGNVDATSLEGFSIITTDTKKSVLQFEPSGHLLGKFGGSDIKGFPSYIHVHGKYLLEGGLDRYVRVFELKNRNMLLKVFAGGKVSSMLLLDVADVEMPLTKKEKKRRNKRVLDEEQEREEDNELWAQLDGSSKRRKSKPRSDR